MKYIHTCISEKLLVHWYPDRYRIHLNKTEVRRPNYTVHQSYGRWSQNSVLTFTDKHLVSLGDCLGQEETHNPLLTDVEESLRLLRGPDTNLREPQIPECFS